MWKAWAYVFSVTISFGEAFGKRNICAKNDICKTKETYKSCFKIILVYSVKCILRCFITSYIQKHIHNSYPLIREMYSYQSLETKSADKLQLGRLRNRTLVKFPKRKVPHFWKSPCKK